MGAHDDPEELAVSAWLARAPTAEETADEEVAPFRSMSGDERLRWFEVLQRAMDEFVADGRRVEDPADSDFWRRWRDPLYGRPG